MANKFPSTIESEPEMKTFILVLLLFGFACVPTFAASPQTVESKLDALIAKIASLEEATLAIKTQVQDMNQQVNNDDGQILAIKTQMQDMNQHVINDDGQILAIKKQMQDMSQKVISDIGQIFAIKMQMGLVRPSVQQQERQAEYNRQEEIQQAINDPGRY